MYFTRQSLILTGVQPLGPGMGAGFWNTLYTFYYLIMVGMFFIITIFDDLRELPFFNVFSLHQGAANDDEVLAHTPWTLTLSLFHQKTPNDWTNTSVQTATRYRSLWFMLCEVGFHGVRINWIRFLFSYSKFLVTVTCSLNFCWSPQSVNTTIISCSN